jgi:hypothetical protein
MALRTSLPRAAAPRPGADFANPHFGRKASGQILILELWPKLHPKLEINNYVTKRGFMGFCSNP